MTEVYLGGPPEHIKQWIIDHTKSRLPKDGDAFYYEQGICYAQSVDDPTMYPAVQDPCLMIHVEGTFVLSRSLKKWFKIESGNAIEVSDDPYSFESWAGAGGYWKYWHLPTYADKYAAHVTIDGHEYVLDVFNENNIWPCFTNAEGSLELYNAYHEASSNIFGGENQTIFPNKRSGENVKTENSMTWESDNRFCFFGVMHGETKDYSISYIDSSGNTVSKTATIKFVEK